MKRILSAILTTALLMPCFSAFATPTQPQSEEKPLLLWYDEEAPYGNENMSEWFPNQQKDDDGWEKWALPLGNGYMGAMVFGRTNTERVQITENSLSNPYRTDASGRGGLNNFAEVYFDFAHNDVTNYRRQLDIREAVQTVSYTHENVNYTREYLTSYPDKVLAINLKASELGKINFTLHPEIPYIKEYGGKEGDNQGKSGTVTAENDTITLKGKMDFYNILFEGQIKVIPKGGTMTTGTSDKGNGTITVAGADEVTVLMAVGTNYKLESRVFTEPDRTKKLEPYPDPHQKVTDIITLAVQKDYDAIKQDHIADYTSYFNRTTFDIGSTFPSDLTTDKLVAQYKSGTSNLYLEELYFQYGRYLLIASSRQGTLPSNLQGIWNRYDSAPWTSGYWHNINVQMNYWPAFSTNLAEMFEPYADYNAAYLPLAQQNATKYVTANFPDKVGTSGGDGWGIGTGAWPYTINEVPTQSHSGPGTTAFTSKLFWDYYDFTRDSAVLENTTFPVVSGVSQFLSKVTEETDGLLLTKFSASPEQLINGTPYMTKGTTFDQQMIYENHKDTLAAAKLIGKEDDPVALVASEQIDKLDSVPVGKSGHVKEFREENYYGEIGDKTHRHVSQLVGLYPGNQINATTPAWLDASKVTLKNRGVGSTGWAMAHRMNLWARVKDGQNAYTNLQAILKQKTLTNLWDSHPPFQIDGNFGATAGIAEMLLQSHEGYLDILPALTDAWKTGSYTGLVGRGNFEVSAWWTDSTATKIEIKSRKGGECAVKYYNLNNSKIVDSKGNNVTFTADGMDIVRFDTTEGETYTITDITPYTKPKAPTNISVSKSSDTEAKITWTASDDATSYKVYRAIESAADYELLAENVTDTSINYTFENPDEMYKQTTYRVTCIDSTGRESDGVTKLSLGSWKPQGTVIFSDEFAATKPNQGQLEKMGWYELETENKTANNSESAANGELTATSGQLVLKKTSNTSTPSAANAGGLVHAAVRQFSSTNANWSGDERVTLRTENFKGKYALDVTVSFPHASGQVWLYVMGNTETGVKDQIMGAFKVNGSSSTNDICIYNNKLNASVSDLPIFTSAKSTKQIRIVFDSGAATFQVFDGDSATPIKTSVANANPSDTFSMTGWGVRKPGVYITNLKIGAQKQFAQNSEYAKIDMLRLTELEAADDAVVDGANTALTMASVTDTPSTQISPLKALPATLSGASITWTSSNPNVISHDGKTVVQGGVDTDVTMTAKITNPTDGFTVYKDFRITVPAKPRNITIQTVTTDAEGVHAQIKINTPVESATAIAAVYDKVTGALVNMIAHPLTSVETQTVTFNMAVGDYELRVFVFDSLKTIKPLALPYK